MRVSLPLLALLLLSCGAGTRAPLTDGAASSGGDVPSSADAGAPGCPARVAPGLPCIPGTRPCLGDDRCNDCFCTAARWVCDSRVCVDAGVCPSGRPRTGDACESVGQVCSYGAGCAGAECLCAGGRWTCDAFYCSDS